MIILLWVIVALLFNTVLGATVWFPCYTSVPSDDKLLVWYESYPDDVFWPTGLLYNLWPVALYHYIRTNYTDD